MTDISAAAGIKVGQIYRDFDGKEAIVAEIVENDLLAFLDEPALAQAIRSTEPADVRHWIGRFIQRDYAPPQGQLLSQIIIEAARNERIAELLQCANHRIVASLERAFARIIPHAVQDRVALVETIMVLMVGLTQRQLITPDLHRAALAATLSALVEREIDRLTIEAA